MAIPRKTFQQNFCANGTAERCLRVLATSDPVAKAESAADLTLMVLLQPERANRLLEYHARDASEPTLEEVIDATLRSAYSASGGLTGLVSTAVKDRIVEALFRLASDPKTSFGARSVVTAKLRVIGQSLPTDPFRRCSQNPGK
jgi:hypothetical protein